MTQKASFNNFSKRQQLNQDSACINQKRDSDCQNLKKVFTGEDKMEKSKPSQACFQRKQSQVTQCSVTQDCQNSLSFLNTSRSDHLFVTFGPNYPLNQTKMNHKETLMFRYKSSSLDRIVLYALIFTHFHVDTMIQKPVPITHIFYLNQANIQKLSAVLQEIQKETIEKKKKQSLQSISNFISGFSQTRKNRFTEDLKVLVNNIETEDLSDILRQLGKNNFKSSLLNSSLNLLATALKIRITLEEQGVRKDWGSRNGKIRYLIKRDHVKGLYYLADIFFYKDSDNDQVQKSTTKKLIGGHPQYAEI